MKARKILALVLAFAMALSTMSFNVFAEGTPSVVFTVGNVMTSQDATTLEEAIELTEYFYETIGNVALLGAPVITLEADYEFATPVVIDSEYPINIDLNGHTMTYNSTTQGEAMITNKGNLTINDSSDPDTGVINYNYTGEADSLYGKGNYTISNGGTLTVNGGKITIANLRAHAKYPIDNNSTTGDAILVINGGHLYNYNTSAIRQFCNSTTNQNSVTINGGLIEGYSAIWVQNPSSTATANAVLSITGGEIKSTAAAYVNGTSELKDVASKIYCTTEGGAWSEDSAVSITGGTFNENVYLAEEAPADLTISEEATFNGYITTPESDDEPVAKIVATVGEENFTDLQEAIVAAAPDGTVEIVNDVTVDKWIMISETLSIGSGQIITIDEINGLTIDGKGHSLTINGIESAKNGDRLFYDATNLNIKDLTINYANGVTGGVGLTSGEISNVKFNGGVGILPGEGDITITGCTFNTSGSAIYNETDRDNLVVTGNHFETAAGQYAIYLRGNTTFTDNTIVSGKVNVVNGSPVVTGNDFGQERFKVYNGATATITGNEINNLVFNDDSEVMATFSENTLSAEAEEALKDAGVIKANEVAQIGDEKFASLAEAVEAAKAGDTITLIADATVAEGTDVTIPDGVVLNGNGFAISSSGADHDATTSSGYIIAGGNLTIKGTTKIEKFSAGYYDHTITVGEGASLEVFGKNRVSVGYGSSFYVSGTVSDAKTADKSQIQPSLNIAAGLSIVGGNDTVFEVENAYVIIGDTSSKNSNAGGKFDITFENSIVDFTKQFSFSTPKYDTLNPVFNVNVKDSVMTTGTKLMIAASGTVMTIDNSTVTLGSYLRNSGKLTLKNGSKLTGSMIQFGENGGNDGEIVVDNSEFEIICTSTGHAMDGNGTGVITLKNGSKANISYIQESTINVDAKSSLITKLLADNTVNGAFVEQNDGTHLVGALPEAEVSNLGKISVEKGEGAYTFEDTYYIYDLLGNQDQKMATSSEAFDLNIAMQFVSKDTEAEAAKNAYGNYTTDFFIKIDGLENGSFVGDGCYLAGYYPTFGAWVKIPLDGFTVEDGKLYPVITSAGFDFKYTDICASVKNFICGIYLTPEVLEANPDIKVNLALGLSETMEDALNAEFTTVDDYTYVADDFIEAAPTLSGTGTEEDPFLINNIDELILFRDSVNAGNNYAGKYVKLNDNIDMSAVDNWTPIGDTTYDKKYAPVDASVVFSGVFDGNDKAISNLKIEKYFDGNPDTDANLGLFGIIGEGAVVKDLTITNVDIDTDGRNIGALAGVAHKATLENITVNGDIQITGGNNVSGVCAMTRHYDMSATNITVSGDDGSAINGNNIVGGIFAEIAPNGSTQTFENLSVENIAINGVGGVGGIVGLLTGGTISTVSVKNVELVGKTTWKENEDRIRLGSIAGLLGGTSATISNIVAVENVNAKNLEGEDVELPVVGANYDASSNATEARIGDTYYSTLVKAFAAANGKGTVTLLTDIDLKNEPWTPIQSFSGVFDGAGHTISNLVVNGEGNNNQGFFAETTNGEIKNVAFNNAKVTGRLNVGVVAGTPYTSKYTNIKITGHVEVNGMSYVGGMGGKNSYANITDITIDVDETSYVKATSTENGLAYRTYVGGVIGFMGEGGHTVKNVTSNINVIGDVCDIGGIVGIAHYGNKFENITCTGNVTNTNTNEEDTPETGGIAGVWHNQAGQKVTFTNISFTGKVDASGVSEDTAIGAPYNASNTTEETSGSLIIDNEVIWPIPVNYVATVTSGDVTTGYETFADAIAAAQEGDTVTLLSDIELAQTVTVENGKTITLDLAGKTIIGVPSEAKAYAVITNKGNLTIEDSVGEGKILCDHKITGSTAYAVNTITNAGTLTVNGGTIENKSTSTNQIGYAIDNNSTSAAATVTINGAAVTASGSNYYDGIRQFCNSTTLENSVVVKDGSVSSIWVQNPSDGATDKNTKDVKGSVSVTGGTVTSLYLEPSTLFEASVTGGNIGTLGYFQTAEGRNLEGFVTGGTFTNKPEDAFAAEGYEFTQNEDNTYGVTEKAVFEMFRRNMVLGNSLAMNIYYKAEDITDTGSYVVIEQHMEDEVKETKINIADCEQRSVEGINCYVVSYKGVAACEMSDSLTFTVYNSNGEQISKSYTTSIRDYAEYGLDSFSKQSGYEKWMTTFVDMLNYGAGAQKTFGYKKEDLANKNIDDYQVHASEDVVLTEVFECSETDIAKASLFLRNKVEFNAYFKNVTEGMYIEVEYVNYYGETKTETIYYEDFVTRGEYRGATVSSLAIADAESLVTARLFSADGTEQAWLKESINGYLYRVQEQYDDELYPALAKFAKSAAESLN